MEPRRFRSPRRSEPGIRRGVVEPRSVAPRRWRMNPPEGRQTDRAAIDPPPRGVPARYGLRRCPPRVPARRRPGRRTPRGPTAIEDVLGVPPTCPEMPSPMPTFERTALVFPSDPPAAVRRWAAASNSGPRPNGAGRQRAILEKPAHSFLRYGWPGRGGVLQFRYGRRRPPGRASRSTTWPRAHHHSERVGRRRRSHSPAGRAASTRPTHPGTT